MKPKLVPLQIAKKPSGSAAPSKEKDLFLSNEAQTLSQSETQSSLGGNRKILVVDDNPTVLKAFELKLKANGFEVITTTDGSQVVSTAGQESPDLIILDVNFAPGGGTGGAQWNGLTILQWLRRFQEVAGIPVIVVTGEEPSKCKEKLLAAGAVDFFQKPVDFGQLLAAILRVLGK
ncbi:MAG TPA: response regulator [Verrucomicrobiae bacterium]|nr:response regulator [Verrucomicrobiae bacterium]